MTHLHCHTERNNEIRDQRRNLEQHQETINPTVETTVLIQDGARDSHGREILAVYQWLQGEGDVHNVQQNGVNEPHTDTMQGKDHSTNMASNRKSLATQAHPMAQSHPWNNPRLR